MNHTAALLCRILLPLSLVSALVLVRGRAERSTTAPGEERFEYDPTDHVVPAEMVAGDRAHDAAVALVDGEEWVTWLEQVPGDGDRVVLRRHAEVIPQVLCEAEGRRRARPTLTPSPDGRVYLSFEERAEGSDDWDLRYFSFDASGGRSGPFRCGTPDAKEVRHAAATGPDGALWFAARRSTAASDDIAVCRVVDGEPERWTEVSDSPRGDWHPDIGVARDGAVCVVWDSFDGASFSIRARWNVDGRWGSIYRVSDTPAFEARARLAFGAGPEAWITWEEGARNWGKRYVSNPRDWNNSTAEYGPLHSFRKVRVLRLGRDGEAFEPAFPMPSFAAARGRDRRPDAEALGVYYERPQIVVDDTDRPWVVVRHFFENQLAGHEAVLHHIEKGWRLDARALEGDSFSPLYSFATRQRDGTQRLSLAPTARGFVAAWDTGRTDRRQDPEPRGVALGRVEREPGAAPRAGETTRRPLDPRPPAPRRPPPTTRLAGEEYHLVFGDLHRHTDLSLCFPFLDGSVDDAYRYAREVAELDFLGITDHARDLARGNVHELLWWRSIKEVDQHHVPGRFHPFYAFERSQGDTDHNVISLRDDMLRSWQPPLPEFWKEITDNDTITIPHMTPDARFVPFIGRVWTWPDTEKRPLVEVWQGCRDREVFAEVIAALKKGYRLGVIASSDHLSTSASYAGVWTPANDRTAVFRSLQARRTYGATARIALRFHSKDHWMGETMPASAQPVWHYAVQGTAALTRVEVLMDGELIFAAPQEGRPWSEGMGRFPRPQTDGAHWLQLVVEQEDGNRAWSSPLWIGTDGS